LSKIESRGACSIPVGSLSISKIRSFFRKSTQFTLSKLITSTSIIRNLLFFRNRHFRKSPSISRHRTDFRKCDPLHISSHFLMSCIPTTKGTDVLGYFTHFRKSISNVGSKWGFRKHREHQFLSRNTVMY